MSTRARRGPAGDGLFIVGLVGRAGSGKSAVANTLAADGATVIAADLVGHEVTDQDPEVRAALALEYGEAYGFPVFINRCGVLAGGGQFGRADQGIYSFWVHSWLQGRALSYIGFDGEGHQVRDCLHPADLVPLIQKQLENPPGGRPRVLNVSGGRSSARSLRQLSLWCAERIGPARVGTDARSRPFDVPWMVLDSRRAQAEWDWAPRRTTDEILDEILDHARVCWIGLE